MEPRNEQSTAQAAQQHRSEHQNARNDVQQLLDKLGRAVTSGDGKAAAALWEMPALVIGDQQVTAVASAQEVEQFFGGAKEQYNAKGITDTRPEIARLDWPTKYSREIRPPLALISTVRETPPVDS